MTTPTNNQTASKPYAEQMAPLMHSMSGFLRSRAPHFMCDHDLSGDWPENAKTEQVYTRSKVTAAVKRFIKTAIDAAKYASALPTGKALNKTGIQEALAATYTVTRGDNKGNVRNLLMNACGAARRNFKRTARTEATNVAIYEAIDNGGAYFADGVTLKDGTPRPYPTEATAAKAWARSEDNYGGNWWAENKAARLAEAATHVRRGLPTSGAVYATMSAAKCIGLAKKANAPTSVTTGEGAGIRSRNWLTDNAI